MNLTLLKRELKANWKLLLIFMAVLSMYAAMIISMFDPKLGDSLQSMADSMPEVFAAFGMMESGSTLLDFTVNYLYGFLFVVFPAIFIILLSNKLMARYIDQGSMAYLLATPNKRKTISITQAIFLILSVLLLVVYITVFCLVVGNVLFPGDLDVKSFLFVNAGLFGLLFFFSGLCFFSSSVLKESRLASAFGAGCIIAFILVQMVSQVGDKFDMLKYLTPLTLFDTDGLKAVQGDAIFMMVLLYVIGLIFFCAAIKIFDKRDLSL